MSNLWDLSHIQPETRLVLAGDTIPAMFWNGVRERGPRTWLRQKELGIWRSWSWTQTGDAVREIAGVVAGTIQDTEWDGTYSQHGAAAGAYR